MPVILHKTCNGTTPASLTIRRTGFTCYSAGTGLCFRICTRVLSGSSSVMPHYVRHSLPNYRNKRVRPTADMCKCLPANGESAYDDSAELPEMDERTMYLALQEAAQLYAEAEELSQAQVMQELLDSWVVEKSTAVAIDPKLLEPLANYWLEQGFSRERSYEAARELFEKGSKYCNVEILSTQMQRLRRVIPFEVETLVAKDLALLEATPGQVAQHFVELVLLFEGKNIEDIVRKQPKLLYCDNLTARVHKVSAKLVNIHPSHDETEIFNLLTEYPELVFRMEYYMAVHTIDELPIEIQNMMIVTGQGLNALHKMYQKQARYPTQFDEFVV